MVKTDKAFVKNNIRDLLNKSFANAEKLFSDAKILKEKQSFCSSLFYSISALEELAKWHFLNQNNTDFINLERITNHDFKVNEILKIFQEITNDPQLKKEDYDWLRNNRIKEMREDVLYVRLKPRGNDKNYPIYPKEEYYRKRAKAIIILLESIFEYYKT